MCYFSMSFTNKLAYDLKNILHCYCDIACPRTYICILVTFVRLFVL